MSLGDPTRVNRQRDKIWNSRTAKEKGDCVKNTRVEGNKRLDLGLPIEQFVLDL